jgi:hypothetical protein
MSIEDIKEITTATKPREEEFDEIVPFDESNLPSISASLLPYPFNEFAAGLAEELELCESIPVLASLAIISVVAAKKFVVSPKEGWNEPVNIYALISLPPANNKSQVLKRLTKPLIDYEKEQKKLLLPTILKKQSELANREALIKNKRAIAAKEKDTDKQSWLFDQISKMEANPIDLPVSPMLYVNDVTAESLSKIVFEQGERLGILSDEGGLIEVISGLYSGGAANIDIILKGIDGGDVRIIRQDKRYDMNPFLTILLIVQPQILLNIRDKQALKGKGFQERFLYLIPESKLGYRTHQTASVSKAIENEYHNHINQLLAIEHTEAPLKITLSEEAKQQFYDFRNEIEKDLRPNGRLNICQGWGGKICGFTLRIAGLLQIAEHKGHNLVITHATMNNAIEIANALIVHAIKAFGFMQVDQVTSDAQDIADWIKYENIQEFTLTQLTKWSRNRELHKDSRRDKALEELTKRNIISSPKERKDHAGARKPTRFYTINPKYKDRSVQYQ